MPPGMFVCVPCATGDCRSCRRQVIVAGLLIKACACRHGGGIARTADPAIAGGSIVEGPDGAVLLDTARAVIVDTVTTAATTNPSDDRQLAALFLEGPVGRTPARSAILHLLDAELAATLVAEIVGLAARIGPGFESAFRAELDGRMNAADLWPSPVVPAGHPDGSAHH